MTAEIPLSSTKYPGIVALVDDADAELVAGYGWYPVKREKTFYVKAHVPGQHAKNVYMHRLIRPDIAGQIDHADRNGLNNQQVNLRPATDTQQNANQAIRNNNVSGYKGVSWHKGTSKWQAAITVNRKKKHLGYFDDPAEAAHAYDAAARRVFGEFAVCNFPHEKDGSMNDFYAHTMLNTQRLQEETGLSAAEILALPVDEYARLTHRPTPTQAALQAADFTPPGTPRQEPSPPQTAPPAPEPQGIDPHSQEYFLAWRAQRQRGGEGRGLFDSVGSRSDEYTAAVRAQAGRTGWTTGNVVEAPRIGRAYVPQEQPPAYRSAADRFATPGNAFGS